MHHSDEELDALQQSVSEAADFLLPIAVATSWPCRIDLIAWLTAVRDSCATRDPVDLH